MCLLTWGPEKLADHTGLPLVVVDPNGIWNPVWGELYRSTESRANGVNEITRNREYRTRKFKELN